MKWGSTLSTWGELLAAIGYTGSDPIADGVVRLRKRFLGAVIRIDPDGRAGPERPRTLAVVRTRFVKGHGYRRFSAADLAF